MNALMNAETKNDSFFNNPVVHMHIPKLGRQKYEWIDRCSMVKEFKQIVEGQSSSGCHVIGQHTLLLGFCCDLDLDSVNGVSMGTRRRAPAVLAATVRRPSR